MRVHVELVSKTKNTFYKTVQLTLKRIHLWPSGADFRDKLWGHKEELQTTVQYIKNTHLQI